MRVWTVAIYASASGGHITCLNVRCLEARTAACVIEDVLRVQDRPSVRSADRSLKIAKELSDLVVYCQPVTFDWDEGRCTFIVGFFCF